MVSSGQLELSFHYAATRDATEKLAEALTKAGCPALAYHAGLEADIRAEVYLGNPKNFGNQLKYADKRGGPIAVIQGEDERANGEVQVKDLILGAQIAENATLEEWKSRPSLFEVPRAELVASVLEILDGQGE